MGRSTRQFRLFTTFAVPPESEAGTKAGKRLGSTPSHLARISRDTWRLTREAASRGCGIARDRERWVCGPARRCALEALGWLGWWKATGYGAGERPVLEPA